MRFISRALELIGNHQRITALISCFCAASAACAALFTQYLVVASLKRKDGARRLTVTVWTHDMSWKEHKHRTDTLHTWVSLAIAAYWQCCWDNAIKVIHYWLTLQKVILLLLKKSGLITVLDYRVMDYSAVLYVGEIQPCFLHAVSQSRKQRLDKYFQWNYWLPHFMVYDDSLYYSMQFKWYEGVM